MAIVIRPGTDAYALLLLISERDGQLRVADLAARLFPWTAAPISREPGAFAKRQKERAEHVQRARQKTSRLLGRLAEAGLVATGHDVTLWPDAAARWAQEGPASLRRLAEIGEDGPWLAQARLTEPTAHEVNIVAALASGPLAYAVLTEVSGGLTPSGSASGAWQHAYRVLCESQVVRPPSNRRLTPHGWAFLQAVAAA